MFIEVLFAIGKMRKEPKCPSSEERISTMWGIHIVGYYLALKMKEILTCATTWINLEW